MAYPHRDIVKAAIEKYENIAEYNGIYPCTLADNDLLAVTTNIYGWKVRFRVYSPAHKGEKGFIGYHILKSPYKLSRAGRYKVYFYPGYGHGTHPRPKIGRYVGETETQVAFSFRDGTITYVSKPELWNRVEPVVTMIKGNTIDGYDLYHGYDENGECIYNIVPEGSSAPSTGYYDEKYIAQVKGVDPEHFGDDLYEMWDNAE